MYLKYQKEKFSETMGTRKVKKKLIAERRKSVDENFYIQKKIVF